MTDKITGAHPAGLFELIKGQLPEAEFQGHIIEYSVGDGSGVGQCSVKIKE
jgi:hypothetical protein